ncbi:PAC2 family protein [Halobacteria archaeon AArc-m2/3/4]|uniref:PAC2 family protein n=1 Tax=Natronoglomus mannanivorans TaxID=2979990 RepID=A0AAP2Z069_9EURY|nr:PAC2 family protein [Halobacteria archaeon AArc-xg1-1]MCU4971212.1 PAC2 family protein [Halobacteria archaeon AArc-m2/3/4]
MSTSPTFDVVAPDDYRCETLVLGLSNPGFAGVTATEYLSRHLACEEIGHVESGTIPAITPFVDGAPRNHTRIYDVRETPLALVVGELFVPVWAASSFVDALLEWTDRAGIDEIAVPYGVPYPHGPDEHDVFTVATESFHDRRLESHDGRGLRGGVLDGIVGDLIARSLNGDAPSTGAFVTPVHPPGPDLEAVLRLIDVFEAVYGIDVDEGELRRQSEELQQYFAALAERVDAIGEDSGRPRDYPIDRSYM